MADWLASDWDSSDWDVAAAYSKLVKFELSDASDPDTHIDHVIRVRMRKTSEADSGTVRIRLMEGVTEIATFEEVL